MTKFSEKAAAQGDPALRKRLEKVEKLVSALIADGESFKKRLDAVEVVKAGPQDPRVMEPELPFDEQKPETE